MGKSASFLPQDFVAGGAIPDGEYRIAACQTVKFNYGGAGPEVPALLVTYESKDGMLADQNYSAGKLESLVPSEDGKRFVHPGGDDAKVNKSSNFAAFINSIIAAGFPAEKLGDGDVSVFEGTKIVIENLAQPKRAGLDQKEKTIPLVRSIVSLPGAHHKSNGKAATGSLNDEAISAVQEALGSAKDHTLASSKLATNVMLRLAKNHDPNANAIKKLAGDTAWLAENAERGGWSTDGDTVTLG